jgi:hypothetical protein
MMKIPAGEQRYFVVHLREEDRPVPEKHFEIQALDSAGRAINYGFIGNESNELYIDGLEVPRPVIEAARRQLIGRGDYVDERGNSIPPF